MAQSMAHTVEGAFSGEHAQPGYQAYQLLRFVFTVAPIIAGADKFFRVLTNWDQYLAPWLVNLSPISGHNLMLLVGVVEISAGVLTAIKPKIFAYVVAAWLCLIIINLLSMGAFFDVALRDFGLAVAAVALGRLAVTYGKP